MREALIQCIGFGPASLGLVLAADRQKLISPLIKRGICYIDEANTMKLLKEKRFPFYIRSNSKIKGFFDPIDRNGIFHPIFSNKQIDAILTLGEENIIPLSLIGKLNNILTTIVHDQFKTSVKSNVVLNTKVTKVIYDNDHFTSFNHYGDAICHSKYCVLATGAHEPKPKINNLQALYIPSSKIIAKNFSTIHRSAIQNITILGGSHSGFSAAQVLLDHLPIRKQQITMIHKKINLYYESQQDANKDNYPYTLDEVDKESGEINRFTGLRADAKRLYQRCLKQQEPRISLLPFTQADDHLKKCKLIIHATGYSANNIPIFDENHKPIALKFAKKRVTVNTKCQVLDYKNNPLKQLFALGICHGRLNNNQIERVGLNFYQGIDAEEIINDIKHDIID